MEQMLNRRNIRKKYHRKGKQLLVYKQIMFTNIIVTTYRVTSALVCLQDNQSSNGTFINNNRCSLSKEQEPHEVYSGDIVQFGIPVVENTGNSEKVN